MRLYRIENNEIRKYKIRLLTHSPSFIIFIQKFAGHVSLKS